jgi:hypothetical protein
MLAILDNFRITYRTTFKNSQKPKEIVTHYGKKILRSRCSTETPIAVAQVKNYEVFFAEANKIPNLLHEIGRLREITFREVGEGTKVY